MAVEVASPRRIGNESAKAEFARFQPRIRSPLEADAPESRMRLHKASAHASDTGVMNHAPTTEFGRGPRDRAQLTPRAT